MKIRVLFFALLLITAIFGLTLQPVSCFADTCQDCGGSGQITCPDCGGSGISGYTNIHGQTGAYGCERCGGVRGDPAYGTGSQGSGRTSCPACGGSGQVQGQQYSSSGQSASSYDNTEQQKAFLEEQRKKAEEEARLRQEEFEKKKQEALQSMKGIAENEMGLKGVGTSGDLGLKGVSGSGDTGLKTLFEKPSPDSAVVDTRVKGPSKLDVGKNVNFGVVRVRDGTPDAAQLKKDLLDNFSGAILKRTEQPNEQAQAIMRSFKTGEPPNPVKNIDNLALGDVILVAPVPLKDLKKAGAWNVGVSNGINFLNKWSSDNWSSPVSHAAIFLGEKNGKRWYMDNTSAGPIIMEESAFLKEYGARQMDVATLVGQPLSQHEGEEMWEGAHELRNTVKYGPSRILNRGRDYRMVCSETSRWLLLRAGRNVPDVESENGKIFGVDIGLNKKQFVSFTPADFYESRQYFVVHQLGLREKEEKKQ